MGRDVVSLGEFEQMILLAVLQCGDDAYGVTVHNELTRRTKRRVASGAIYMTLDRLEKKGLLESRLTEPDCRARRPRQALLYRHQAGARGAERLPSRADESLGRLGVRTLMQRWLRWLTDARLAESIAGDLEEERRRRAVLSPTGARLWFCRRAFAITAYMLGHRARERSSDLLTEGVAHVAAFGGDLRHATRSLRRTPWYGATVIGVVALSVSLATTVFAVVDGVLFKPLPYPRLDDLVAIDGGWTSRPQLLGNVSASTSDLIAWRTAAADGQFTGYSAGGREQLDAGEPARSAWVAENFFDVLGQQPLVGGFRPEHFAVRNAIQPAVITYLCWQRRFAGDPSVVGRVIRGDRGSIVEVVGILPPDFLVPVHERPIRS